MPILSFPKVGKKEELKGKEAKGINGGSLFVGQLCSLSADNVTSNAINDKATYDMGYGYTFTKQLDRSETTNTLSGTILFDITTDGTTPYLRGRYLVDELYPYNTDTLFTETSMSVDNAVRLVDIPNFETRFLDNPNRKLLTNIVFAKGMEVAEGVNCDVILFIINSEDDNSSLIHLIKINGGRLEYLTTFADTLNLNDIDIQITSYFDTITPRSILIYTYLDIDSTFCYVRACTINYSGITPLRASGGRDGFLHQGTHFMNGKNVSLQLIPNKDTTTRIAYLISFVPYSNTKDETIFYFHYLAIIFSAPVSTGETYYLRDESVLNRSFRVMGDADVTSQFWKDYYYITTSDGAGWNAEYNYSTLLKCTNTEPDLTLEPVMQIEQLDQSNIDSQMNPVGWKRYIRSVLSSYISPSVSNCIVFYSGDELTASPLQSIEGLSVFGENYLIGDANYILGTQYNEIILRENSIAMIYNGALNDLRYPKIGCYAYVLGYEAVPVRLNQTYDNYYLFKEYNKGGVPGLCTVVYPENE